jgi:uncharacterized membrane protein SpoIIM required for sporulation
MFAALTRARLPILSIALTYLLAVGAGIFMVHSGNQFALNYRDKLVHNANATSPILKASHQSHNFRAATLDFSANLFLGAIPQTIAAVGVIPAYPLVAFRGWIGGIVSVTGAHHSRLASSRQRIYYLGVLLLQLLPYSLTGGAGVYLGLAWYRRGRDPGAYSRWIPPFPHAEFRDVLRIYALSIPLFFIASMVEFLAN